MWPPLSRQWRIQSMRNTNFPFLHFRPAWWLTNFIIYGLKWYMTALNWRIIKYFLFVKYFWSNKAIIHYGTTGKTTAFICRHKRSVYGVLFCWLYCRRARDAHKPRLYHYTYLSSGPTLKTCLKRAIALISNVLSFLMSIFPTLRLSEC